MRRHQVLKGACVVVAAVAIAVLPYVETLASPAGAQMMSAPTQSRPLAPLRGGPTGVPHYQSAPSAGAVGPLPRTTEPKRAVKIATSPSGPPLGKARPRTVTGPSVAPSAPSLLTSFQGTSQNTAIATYGGSQAVLPPDPSLAVGPNDVVEATNTALFFFHRNGSANGSVRIDTLVGTPSGFTLTDPRVVYDASTDRFYLTILEYSLTTCTNFVVLLRTDTGDPTSPTAWNGFLLRMSAPNGPGGGAEEADQPGLGFSDNIVAVTWNYFDCNSGALYGSQADMVQKTDLIAVNAAPHAAKAFWGGPLGPQPTVSLGSTAVQYVIANLSYSNTAAIEVDPFTGTPEQQNMPSPTSINEPITLTTVNNSNFELQPAPQSGTTTLLRTDDDRLLNAVWQNGTIWTAGGTNCQPGESTFRACLNIVSIAASSGGSVTGVNQLPFVGLTGAYLYYPAIAVDASGNAYVVFDESSSSTAESVMVAGVVGGAISSFTTLHTSVSFYAPGCTSPTTVGCRWGDYSGAAQDPIHPTDVWVASETVDNNTVPCNPNVCWNTFIGRYTYAPPRITNLTPAAGPTGGGQVVTVNGSDFLPGTTATFAGSPIAINGGTLAPDSFQITTPPHGAGYVQAQATSGPNMTALDSHAGYVYVGLGSYIPLTPFRILDTRTGLCGVNTCSSLGPGGVLTLQLTGYTDPVLLESVPSSATAVALNVTAVYDSSFSLLTVWPNGTGQPLASNLNFGAHTTTANLVVVAVGQSSTSDTQRELEIFNPLGTLNVVADVEGYFSAPSGTTGEFHPIPPLRVCDTRAGQPANVCNGSGGNVSDAVLGPGQSVKVNVTGKPTGVGGTPPVIPIDGTAEAAALNLTAVAGTSFTYLSIFPTSNDGSCQYGPSNPAPSSTINVIAGIAQANRVLVPLGPAATGLPKTDVCVYNSLGNINFLLDANGWFDSPGAAAGTQFQPIGPSRVCDTRAGQGTPCSGHTLGPNTALLVAVAGLGGIPMTGPTAIIANLTAVFGSQGTYLALYPADVTRPNASDLNVQAFMVLPNLAVVQLSSLAPAGDVDLYNSLGNIDGVLDVEGWFQ